MLDCCIYDVDGQQLFLSAYLGGQNYSRRVRRARRVSTHYAARRPQNFLLEAVILNKWAYAHLFKMTASKELFCRACEASEAKQAICIENLRHRDIMS